MDLINVIGSLAALCSVASFLPQAWRIVRTRETASISAPMYALTVVGFALWVAYGISLRQWPVIVPNAICFLTAGFILAMTLLPKRKKELVAETVEQVVK